MKITLEEMQTFASIVDSGSITAAAEQMGITISAVSRTLARLETKLATTLLNRTTRRIKLSEEGATFLAKARQILKLTEEAEELLLTHKNVPSGKLRIDAATPFILHVINPLIPEFNRLYPQIELEISNYEGYIDLLEKKVDIAFRIGKLKDSTLHASLIGYSKLRILASPNYLSQYGEPKNIHELQQHKLLGFTTPESLNHWPLYDKENKSVHIKPTIAASSGEILCSLALKGMGIVCLSDFMTEESRFSGALQQVLTDITYDEKQAINAVYYRNQAVSTRISCFIDFIRTHTSKLITNINNFVDK